jgi:hypothetical protein
VGTICITYGDSNSNNTATDPNELDAVWNHSICARLLKKLHKPPNVRRELSAFALALAFAFAWS